MPMPPVHPGKGMKSSYFLAKDMAGWIGIPLEDWPGKCYGIAVAILEAGGVKGVARYGHWLGGANPGTLFYNGAPFVQHGWIRLDRNTTILRGRTTEDLMDPTRWTFESNDSRDAYIYIGHESEPEYDPGGNRWREAMERPCPAYDPGAMKVELEVESPFDAIMMEMAGNPPGWTIHHLFWFANLSLKTLGLLAKPLYTALANAGHKAYIPLDNWRMVMEDPDCDVLGDMFDVDADHARDPLWEFFNADTLGGG